MIVCNVLQASEPTSILCAAFEAAKAGVIGLPLSAAGAPVTAITPRPLADIFGPRVWATVNSPPT